MVAIRVRVAVFFIIIGAGMIRRLNRNVTGVSELANAHSRRHEQRPTRQNEYQRSEYPVIHEKSLQFLRNPLGPHSIIGIRMSLLEIIQIGHYRNEHLPGPHDERLGQVHPAAFVHGRHRQRLLGDVDLFEVASSPFCFDPGILHLFRCLHGDFLAQQPRHDVEAHVNARSNSRRADNTSIVYEATVCVNDRLRGGLP
jgi:hypothetical protein